MTRRPGLTMTELLVAIFVVAIGLAGVMSMVPFGAKQMSDALVADRATSHAHTIDGLMRSVWKQTVENGGNSEPFWDALDNAASLGAPATPPTAGTSLSVDPADPSASFPVFVDPMGWVGRGGQPQRWVGDSGNTYVPRRNLNLVNNASDPLGAALRIWSQADGFSWDEDSQPAKNAISGLTEREYRYNALAVIQRPSNNQRNTAALKVVVFSNRRHMFYPDGSELVIGQTAGVAFIPGTTAVQIPLNQIPATNEIRKGDWIMDATVSGTIRHANFYRVVSAVENTSGILDIELHAPIKRTDGRTGQYTATVVLLPGVAGVFERAPLTGNPNP